MSFFICKPVRFDPNMTGRLKKEGEMQESCLDNQVLGNSV